MKKIKFNLITKICEEQDFDELLLKILNGSSKNRVNNILQYIDKNSKLDLEMKKQLYEEIFEYVNDINEYYKKTLK